MKALGVGAKVLGVGVKAVFPSHLRRRRFSAWSALLVRVLVTAGLLWTAVLAGMSNHGLASLGFLSAAAVMAIAVARAHRTRKQASAALRFHREVHRALAELSVRGWSCKRNVCWPEGNGDGHLVTAPGGDLGFAIKDCPGYVSDFDLTQTQELASGLSFAGPPHIPVCVAGTGAKQSTSDRGVLCCGLQMLDAELLDAERAFRASLDDEATQHDLLYGDSAAA